MNECQEDIGKEVLGNKPEVDVTNNAEVKVSKINEKVKNAINNITNKIFASIGAQIALIILVILLLKGGHLYIKSKFNWNFSLFNSELIIDKTANVVDQIKKISEFTTINYYDESVLKKERFVSSNNSIMHFFNVQTDSIHEEIVIIAKGVVRAGFNLSRIKEEDIIINQDTITIKLPSPEILDVIANPTDFEIFVENGTWEHDVIATLQTEHKVLLEKRAMELHILEKAKNNGKERITMLFKSFGFNIVNIE